MAKILNRNSGKNKITSFKPIIPLSRSVTPTFSSPPPNKRLFTPSLPRPVYPVSAGPLTSPIQHHTNKTPLKPNNLKKPEVTIPTDIIPVTSDEITNSSDTISSDTNSVDTISVDTISADTISADTISADTIPDNSEKHPNTPAPVSNENITTVISDIVSDVVNEVISDTVTNVITDIVSDVVTDTITDVVTNVVTSVVSDAVGAVPTDVTDNTESVNNIDNTSSRSLSHDVQNNNVSTDVRHNVISDAAATTTEKSRQIVTDVTDKVMQTTESITDPVPTTILSTGPSTKIPSINSITQPQIKPVIAPVLSPKLSSPKLSVSATKLPVSSPKLPVSSPKLPVSSTKSPISSSKSSISSPKLPVSSTKSPISSYKSSISSPKLPVSSPKLPVSSPKSPISSPKLPISSPKLPMSSPRSATKREDAESVKSPIKKRVANIKSPPGNNEIILGVKSPNGLSADPKVNMNNIKSPGVKNSVINMPTIKTPFNQREMGSNDVTASIPIKSPALPVIKNNSSSNNTNNIKRSRRVASPVVLQKTETDIGSINDDIIANIKENKGKAKPTVPPVIKKDDVLPIHMRPMSPKDRTPITIAGEVINPDDYEPIKIPLELIYNFDTPVEELSTDAIDHVEKIINIRKAGHNDGAFPTTDSAATDISLTTTDDYNTNDSYKLSVEDSFPTSTVDDNNLSILISPAPPTTTINMKQTLPFFRRHGQRINSNRNIPPKTTVVDKRKPASDTITSKTSTPTKTLTNKQPVNGFPPPHTGQDDIHTGESHTEEIQHKISQPTSSKSSVNYPIVSTEPKLILSPESKDGQEVFVANSKVNSEVPEILAPISSVIRKRETNNRMSPIELEPQIKPPQTVDNHEIPATVSQRQQNKYEIPPTVSQRQQNNYEIPATVSQRRDDNYEIPTTVSQRRDDKYEIPSTVSQRRDNKYEIPATVSQRRDDKYEIPATVSQRQQNNYETPATASQRQQNNYGIPPTVSQRQQNNYGIPPTVSQRQQNNYGIPPTVSQRQQNNYEIPATVSQRRDNNYEVSERVSERQQNRHEVWGNNAYSVKVDENSRGSDLRASMKEQNHIPSMSLGPGRYVEPHVRHDQYQPLHDVSTYNDIPAAYLEPQQVRSNSEQDRSKLGTASKRSGLYSGNSKLYSGNYRSQKINYDPVVPPMENCRNSHEQENRHLTPSFTTNEDAISSRNSRTIQQTVVYDVGRTPQRNNVPIESKGTYVERQNSGRNSGRNSFGMSNSPHISDEPRLRMQQVAHQNGYRNSFNETHTPYDVDKAPIISERYSAGEQTQGQISVRGSVNRVSEHENKVQTVSGMPDYDAMDDTEKARCFAQFVTNFGIIRKTFPSYYIPPIDDSMSLQMIHVQYEHYLKHATVSGGAEDYRTYLVIFWVIIELIGHSVGLNIGGYTTAQMQSSHKYEKLLIELGEKKYVSGVSTMDALQEGWPVEIKLIFAGLLNAVFFIAIKMLVNKLGKTAADMLIGVITSWISGNRAQPGETLFDGPPQDNDAQNNGGGGFDIMKMIPSLIGMMTGGGGNNTNNGNNDPNNNTNGNVPYVPPYRERER